MSDDWRRPQRENPRRPWKPRGHCSCPCGMRVVSGERPLDCKRERTGGKTDTPPSLGQVAPGAILTHLSPQIMASR
ncbi:hypothetical protein E2C01_020431 [Portunus trituberculatus]|uniref:Uncharacterized protein n=1 Tax=Portunus trituberculatus TaxID=210409 RepID=A0A5B7E354_PORTR|nr:hypothetical protein [Portunus trituberculatus]